MKNQCTKCKRMLPLSEFHKNKVRNDGLHCLCKVCRSEYRKERRILLKRETMLALGGQCIHVDDKGIRCLMNAIDNLDKLELSHPNGDGDKHRALISKGFTAPSFYRALKKLGWDTGGFVVVVMCSLHHGSLDKSGKKNPSYGKLSSNRKKGKFDDSVWLRKKYESMTLEKLAEECGVSVQLILRRMKEFGHPRRKPGQRPK